MLRILAAPTLEELRHWTDRWVPPLEWTWQVRSGPLVGASRHDGEGGNRKTLPPRSTSFAL
jgi:hypothetical protein